jgi:dolichyl-phosphate beta-glucosyltransferase
MKPLVSLVIPSYNSAQDISQSLHKVQAYFAKQSYIHEVIVVNDGSQDHTAVFLKALAEDYPELVALHNHRNMGKGYSIRKAILESSGRYVFYTDADLAYPIEELECLLTPLMAGLYDVSVGSRVHEASCFRLHPRYFRYVYRRHLMSRFFNWIVRASLGLRVMDTQCGFKGFTAGAAKAIFSQARVSGFAFDVEVLLLAQRLDLRIIEMPVTFSYEGEVSTVKIMQNACQALFDLSRIYRWDRQGIYRERS